MKYVLLKSVFFFLIFCSELILAQSTVDLGGKYGKLKFNKTCAVKVKLIIGSCDSIEKNHGYLTRTDGCYRYKSTVYILNNGGVTITARKVGKPRLIPLFFKSKKLKAMFVNDSSVAFREKIRVGISTKEDVLSVHGYPPVESVLQNDRSSIEYGNRDIIFYFDGNGILKEVVVLSENIGEYRIDSGF